MGNLKTIRFICFLGLALALCRASALPAADTAPPATEPNKILSVEETSAGKQSARESHRVELVGFRPDSEGQKLPELTFLGIMSERQLHAAACPKEALLIPVPTSGAADTAPGVNQATSDQAAASGEPRYFVCRLNNLPAGERFLLDDARDGHWDDISFIEAVLIAEGTSPYQRRASLAKFFSALAQLREEITPVTDEMLRVRTVFEFLRGRLLTGSYEQNYSCVAAALATGKYNCVSATVLFNALASGVGIEVLGVETTGHAKSRVVLSNATLDIETTCTDWELLPDHPIPLPSLTETEESIEVSAARPVSTGDTAGDETGDTTVPDREDLSTGETIVRGTKRPARGVSPVEFVATIYFNRGVDFYRQRRFGQALSAYLKASVLDPGNRTVLRNFKATLNNLAIELAKRHNYQEAIHLTEQCLVLDSDFEQFQVNLPLYYQYWAVDLRDGGQEEKAREAEQEAERLLGKYSRP